MLPPSVPAAVATLAVSVDSRVAVNLNYTVSEEILNACIQLCGIRHVLTSRKVMDKLKVNLDAELVYLEDFKNKMTWKDKLAGYWQADLPFWRCSERYRKRELDRLKLQLNEKCRHLHVNESGGSQGGCTHPPEHLVQC